MIVTPRHFVRFVDGRAGDYLTIAFIPGDLAANICHPLQTNVSLNRDYALKLLKRKIRYDEFGEIQNTIDKGMCLLEDASRLAFLYIKDQVRPVIYFLLIKTDRTRKELWLVTFHRIRQAQFDKRRQFKRLLKDQDLEGFLE